MTKKGDYRSLCGLLLGKHLGADQPLGSAGEPSCVQPTLAYLESACLLLLLELVYMLREEGKTHTWVISFPSIK